MAIVVLNGMLNAVGHFGGSWASLSSKDAQKTKIEKRTTARPEVIAP
jgi:hypothetical protein